MKRDLLIVGFLTLCLSVALLKILPTSSQSLPVYDPWCDLDDNGEVDMRDVGWVARKFGSTGDSFLTKAGLLRDSGWIDITDKAGQCYTYTHLLNNTDVLVEVTGKTTIDGGIHQMHYGLSEYVPGWNKTYYEFGVVQDIIRTSDLGYVIVTSEVLIRIDRQGNLLWNRTYNGGTCVVQSVGGGFALGGIGIGSEGNVDFWLVKTDAAGTLEWDHTYNGAGNWSDSCWSLVQTKDHGYALAGKAWGDQIGFDMWLVKTDVTGQHVWNHTYGTHTNSEAISVVQTSDGGYALMGYIYETYGATSIVKTFPNGTMHWNRTYAGYDGIIGYNDLIYTNDGGYALAGSSGNQTWILKTNSTGHPIWNQTYPYAHTSTSCLVQTLDGGFALAGPISGNSQLTKTDWTGTPEWNRTFEQFNVNCIVQTSDGDYVLAGSSASRLKLIRTGIGTGLAWIHSTPDTITLCRGATDPYWNFVRVRIWQIKNP